MNPFCVVVHLILITVKLFVLLGGHSAVSGYPFGNALCAVRIHRLYSRSNGAYSLLQSQNIEDFLIPSIREFTKPLFSIPTHQFLFNAGQINPKEYTDALQVEQSEFDLIKYPERDTCLYRCGNERYLLQVTAPEYKSALFGKAGGR